jgi:hypothetical protein
MKSLDKFINNVRTEVAKRFDLKTDAEIDAFFIGLEDSAKDNQEALEKRDKMLRDTAAELCEAKWLLKAAVEDMKDCMYYHNHCEYCALFDDNGDCPVADNDECGEKHKWRYADEALALIGEDGDEK